MLYHSELNLISQLAALDLPTDPIALPDYSLEEMVATLLEKVDTLKGDAAMSSKEWALSLGLIKGNPRLTSLNVLAYTNQPQNGLVAYCFSDLTENTAIIAFRGTTGIGWVDNIKGGFICDTPQQLKALDFFHEVDAAFNFDSYTMTGHSKGGNNGQYITIVDGNKVSNCVTFNSQGFSAEFIRKYCTQIIKNKNKIVAYEAAWDVVNILLNSIAGRRVVVGTESRLPHHNHPPNRLLDQSGDIRTPDQRHPFYAGFQNFTMSLTKMSSMAKQQLEKNKSTKKDSEHKKK
ncbi:Mbeg1-like protein [Acetobacterium bakii]|uniref:Mbeg1-like protein n=1 Tax=Acetobacterium bakii TaxID=52689 RepID=UPI000680C838|nr:Mbeg1-like protein [Acetobacterium bakii]